MGISMGKCPKSIKWPSFSHFGGTKNDTSGARIKKFQKTDPPKLAPKTPDRTMWEPKSDLENDFWPFYWFLTFSHWNSHCSRKKLRTAEGVVLQRKQKVFRNLWTKWNNMKPCRSWMNQIFWIRITLPTWAILLRGELSNFGMKGWGSGFRFSLSAGWFSGDSDFQFKTSKYHMSWSQSELQM